jgi:two-component system, chemotaxis family, chemotaxis protein CheY
VSRDEPESSDVKILIVDDSEVMRTILRRALSSLERLADATILEAADGHEGLAAIRSQQPDVVLSDWHMPAMTGIELLRALNREGLTPSFGFVTSGATPGMRELATANGARFVVHKPFTADTLDAALATTL